MYIMSWTFPSRAFGILLGVLCDLGNLPMNRFWRHVFYIIKVNDAATEGNVEDVFFFIV